MRISFTRTNWLVKPAWRNYKCNEVVAYRAGTNDF